MWTRPPVDRTGTEERFEPVTAKFVRLVCEAQDSNPKSASGFRIDEFEVWSADEDSRNVALASNGGKATGNARRIEDFPGAYGPQLAIDGKTGARFIAAGTDLTIRIGRTDVDRPRRLFQRPRLSRSPSIGNSPSSPSIESKSLVDGQTWQVIASSARPQAVDRAEFLNHRLLKFGNAARRPDAERVWPENWPGES